jgi:hypothetical protein
MTEERKGKAPDLAGLPDQPLHPIPGPGEHLAGIFDKNKTYALLKQGLLEGVKIGNKTYITHRSLWKLPDSLPQYVPHTCLSAMRATEGRKRKREESAS